MANIEKVGITTGLTRLDIAQQHARVIGEARLIQRTSHQSGDGSGRSVLEVDWVRPKIGKTPAHELAQIRAAKKAAGIRYLGQ